MGDPVLYNWVKHYVLGVEKTPTGFKYKLGLMFGERTGIIKYGIPEYEIGPDWYLEGPPLDAGFSRSHFEQAMINAVAEELGMPTFTPQEILQSIEDSRKALIERAKEKGFND